ncbi:MAG TPA: LysR family transcriptional regulator [Persephonella sp.]|nr:LysR family transcriptional regulator [Persephonella sp.]
MEVLDYHKLKIFKTVADLKSFSKAAEVLFLTQPTVTLQIKKLENYLGVTLLKRDKSGISLTEEGKLLYEYANKIIEDYIQMEEALSSIKKDFSKILVIGASSTIGEFLLPKFLPSFLQEHKNLKLNLFIGNSKAVEEGILSKNFYIGLVEDEISSNKISATAFYEDEIVLIANANCDIPEEIEVDQIKNYEFIFREKGSGTRNIVETVLGKEGIEIKPNIEISSSKAIARMVANSKYLAFVSKLVIENELRLKNLKVVKVKDFQIKRRFSYITQKNIRLPSTERKFINKLFEFEF